MIKRILPVAALFLAASASPALADDLYTLDLAASTTSPVAGQPMLFQMSGTSPPPAEYWHSATLSLVAISPSVIADCPPDEQGGIQVAENTGGVVISIWARLNKDEQGNYENIVGYTPRVEGPELICGYVVNEVGYTHAAFSALMDVGAAPSSGGGAPPPSGGAPATPSSGAAAKPANARRPRVKRSGNRLVCDPGTWSGGPTRYAYGWRFDGRRSKKAAGRKLAVTRALRGRSVQCSVRASNAAGAASAVSRPVRLR